jgi:hypothetical protein
MRLGCKWPSIAKKRDDTAWTRRVVTLLFTVIYLALLPLALAIEVSAAIQVCVSRAVMTSPSAMIPSGGERIRLEEAWRGARVRFPARRCGGHGKASFITQIVCWSRLLPYCAGASPGCPATPPPAPCWLVGPRHACRLFDARSLRPVLGSSSSSCGSVDTCASYGTRPSTGCLTRRRRCCATRCVLLHAWPHVGTER